MNACNNIVFINVYLLPYGHAIAIMISPNILFHLLFNSPCKALRDKFTLGSEVLQRKKIVFHHNQTTAVTQNRRYDVVNLPLRPLRQLGLDSAKRQGMPTSATAGELRTAMTNVVAHVESYRRGVEGSFPIKTLEMR